MTFSAVLGQGRALTLLDRALESGRLAHGYLFSGPDGVGKTTVALDLAAVLLCRRPEAGRACGQCPGCRKFSSSNHPDFLRIRPDGAAIKIDQIRELKKALAFAPLEGSRRVVILEEVHTMRREAGNSLLKILEEPPPNNLLILVGNTPGSMLATIVSRCQVIAFAPLPLDLAATVLRRLRPELDETAAGSLAALADGCPGRALALEAEGVLPLYRRLVAAILAPASNRAARVEQALALAVEMGEIKEGLELLLALVRILLINALTAHAAPTVRVFAPEVHATRERWSFQQLSAKLTTLDLAEQALARNCNRGLTSEVLLLDLFDCSPIAT